MTGSTTRVVDGDDCSERVWGSVAYTTPPTDAATPRRSTRRWGRCQRLPQELFLQRLPGNVRMVLASADPATDLAQLAVMADKVSEVATPTVSATLCLLNRHRR